MSKAILERLEGLTTLAVAVCGTPRAAPMNPAKNNFEIFNFERSFIGFQLDNSPPRNR